MTKAELFNHITHIIASPHTAITEHDKRRAVQVFLGFDEYLVDVDVAAGRCDVGDEYDFCSYATEILDELEGKLTAQSQLNLNQANLKIDFVILWMVILCVL